MIDAETEGEGKSWIAYRAWVRGWLMELEDSVEKQA